MITNINNIPRELTEEQKEYLDRATNEFVDVMFAELFEEQIESDIDLNGKVGQDIVSRCKYLLEKQLAVRSALFTSMLTASTRCL